MKVKDKPGLLQLHTVAFKHKSDSFFHPGPLCYLLMPFASMVEFSIGENFKGSLELPCTL